MRARMMGRCLFLPFDPLATLVGRFVLRSGDSRDLKGDFSFLMEAVFELERSRYEDQGRGHLMVHDATSQGEDFYPMAFIAPDWTRLPVWYGRDPEIVRDRMLRGRRVVILWRLVASAPRTGAVPNAPGITMNVSRPSYDPTRAW